MKIRIRISDTDDGEVRSWIGPEIADGFLGEPVKAGSATVVAVPDNLVKRCGGEAVMQAIAHAIYELKKRKTGEKKDEPKNVG